MLLVSALAVVGGFIVIAFVRDGPYVAATAPLTRMPSVGSSRREGRGSQRSAISDTCGSSTRCGWIVVLAAGELYRGWGGRRHDVGIAGGVSGHRKRGRGMRAGRMMADHRARARCHLGDGAAQRQRRSLPGSTAGARCGSSRLSSYFAVVADSAQFSALVSEHAPREHVGTALTVQTCLGFLLTIVPSRSCRVWRERSGGAASLLVPARCWGLSRCGVAAASGRPGLQPWREDRVHAVPKGLAFTHGSFEISTGQHRRAVARVADRLVLGQPGLVCHRA